jgi:hypothetical protein
MSQPRLKLEGEHRRVVGEEQAVLDVEDELGGVVVHLPVLRHEAPEHGALVGVLELREPVVEGLRDLRAVELAREQGVDVGGDRDELGPVDELASLAALPGGRRAGGPRGGVGAPAAVVVVAAAGAEREDARRQDRQEPCATRCTHQAHPSVCEEAVPVWVPAR